MASADYHKCDNPLCTNKAFYDADCYYYTDPEENEMLGELKALCKECSENYELRILPKQ